MKTLFFSIIFISLSFLAKAQNNEDPILLIVNGEEIKKSEFLSIYNKNNKNNQMIDNKSIEEYLELFINFKLKVHEAKELGYDTVQSFVKELAGYRVQLAKPYLSDQDVSEQLMREAHERMNWDIRASHILIKIPANPSPKDTLEAYNKCLKLRKRILNGEDFASVAKKESEDPSAGDKYDAKGNLIQGNGGDIGYFSAFDLVYPFENAAYKMEIGEISMPVRTQFGYHLIKVNDKKKALGKVQVAHILIKIPENATAEDSIKAKTKAEEVYQKIQAGSDFTELVKNYSDDKGSSEKDGLLPWFGSFRMIPDFIIPIYDMEIGDISAPILTNYGYHIIKLIDHTPIGTYEESLNFIKQKIAKDKRSEKTKDSFVNKLKKEYGFAENEKALADFYEVVDDSIFYSNWKIEKAKGLNDLLFTIGDKEVYQDEFAEYLSQRQSFQKTGYVKDFVDMQYNNFVRQTCVKYESTKLEEKYPEFKALLNEYRDGILLFNLTNDKVWEKAVTDTLGLEAFYEENKSKYMWDERVEAYIYTCQTEKTAKKLYKDLKKGKLSPQDLLNKYNDDSQLNLSVKTDKFRKGDNEIIDGIEWKKTVTKPFQSGESYIVVDIKEVLAPRPKEIKEARGIITADYQDYLESIWIKNLREKYEVKVFDDVLKSIK
jgi:peptidyl-prolyl cis-trans isomerase SurA